MTYMLFRWWKVGTLLCTLVTLWASMPTRDNLNTTIAAPLAQTCPATNCPQPRVNSYQPRRYGMRSTFRLAAANALGNNGPVYSPINYGIPPNMITETVSSVRPLPHIILRGVAWQESHWLQFANQVTDPDDTNACTLVAAYPDCGYGLMQITDCMSDGCSWFVPSRVAGELAYNLGTGTNFLINAWNIVPTIGNNNHPVAEQWYFALIYYNYWGTVNDPNNATFYPDRPPYGEGNYANYAYPYQEKIWGWIAHPEGARPIPTPNDWHWLWRPTRLAWIPKGIFGLRGQGDWRPPHQTPQPIFHLLSSIRVSNGNGPSIVLRNTTNQTLAADVVLYNTDHTFNRWWLGAPPNDSHNYPYRYIRLNAYESRSLSVSDIFAPSEAFDGYALVSASEGVDIAIQSHFANKIFLPVILKEHGDNCYQQVLNGGFEWVAGQPVSWSVSSTEDYSLADGTWFANGHYGAYLGGYDFANDSLGQFIGTIPQDAVSANLTYMWYVQSQELTFGAWDSFHTRLRDYSGKITTLYTITNQSPRDTWHTTIIDLRPYTGKLYDLLLEAETDYSNPTRFFIDNVSLWICRP